MIKVNQIKLHITHNDKDIKKAITKKMNLHPNAEFSYKIIKKSIDSRKKPELFYIYSALVFNVFENGKKLDEDRFLKRNKNHDIIKTKEVSYEFPVKKKINDNGKNPVVVGFGPAGMFAALFLSRAGLKPVVIERGQRVDDRKKTVDRFWETGELDTESNVQFGEGGAGTFSDGKLNTMIKDPSGRIGEVLKVFTQFGAKEEILYDNKPHIGTDVLAIIVENIRKEIESLGGKVLFDTKLEKINTENTRIKGITAKEVRTGNLLELECDELCLAIGHSARDTFEVLDSEKICEMEPKAFAVGLRMEHPQSLIDSYSYGSLESNLPASSYKVTAKATDGRGIYSFCMCPGGYVVNASSENGMTAVNGMSYSGRDGDNANSAIIVTVTPEDFGNGVLDGMYFQRELERKAYEAGKGLIPVQRLKDFKENVISGELGHVIPSIKGKYTMSNLRNVLPGYISNAIIEAVPQFDRQIKGFDMADAILSGVESRTSSPIRIVRDPDTLQSNLCGLYPCGEGAGYAGGITSAAVDGIKVAEKIAVWRDNRMQI